MNRLKATSNIFASLTLALLLGCSGGEPEVKVPSYLPTNPDGSVGELTQEQRQELVDAAKERTEKREKERQRAKR